MSSIRQFTYDERGATAIEYGLIAALVAVVIIAGASGLGKNVGATFNKIASNVSGTSS